MNDFARRRLTPIAAAILVVACGGDGGVDEQSEALTKSSRAESACDLLKFDDVERFAANDFLFFRFEHPKGWLHKPSASGMPGHGWIQSQENDRIQIEYLLSQSPMAADGPVTQMRESTMMRLEPLAYGGVDVQPYGKSIGRNATLGLMLPHGGDYYDVLFNFHGPKGCDQALIERLSATVLRSLEPNPSTNFGN